MEKYHVFHTRKEFIMHYILRGTLITMPYKIEEGNITRNSPWPAKKKYQQTKTERSLIYTLPRPDRTQQHAPLPMSKNPLQRLQVGSPTETYAK